MQVIDVLAFSHIGFVVDSIDGFRATWGALLGLGSVDFWALHKEHRAVAGPGDLPTELAAADVVLCDASTGPPPWLTRQRLPKALWVTISPYGSAGPRARWRGSELTCLAASGNLYVTGDPDRPPVGCSRPTATPHAGVEAAVATLFGLAAGAREVDMSAQEAVMSANMTAPGAYRALRPRGVGAPARHHARHRPVSGQRVAAPDGAVARVPVDQRRKLSVRSNAKSAEGLALIRRLVIEWADLVIENFTAGVLPRWGLGYQSVSAQRPDLVMISTNLWGVSGPHCHEAGYGGQGQAMSGHVFLTGWPDRLPVGPFGMITDSLSARLGAAAGAAALRRRARTGTGCHIDISQVESSVWSLGQWFADWQRSGRMPGRQGNDWAPDAITHGVFPCRRDDSWIAIATWTPRDQEALLAVLGGSADGDGPPVADLTTAWDADELAERLQEAGVEAYRVHDHASLHGDPQLATRRHFVPFRHPLPGPLRYERCGFRDAGSDSDPAVPGDGPAFGAHTETVLRQILVLTDSEIDSLREHGALH